MAKLLAFGGVMYRPVLDKDGKMDARTAVAYGPRGEGKFMLSVYFKCLSTSAGKRGGRTEDMHADVRAWRETVPNTMPEEEQRRRLEFNLNVQAHQLEADYVLRLPIETRRTPIYSRKKEKTNGV